MLQSFRFRPAIDSTISEDIPAFSPFAQDVNLDFDNVNDSPTRFHKLLPCTAKAGLPDFRPTGKMNYIIHFPFFVSLKEHYPWWTGFHSSSRDESDTGTLFVYENVTTTYPLYESSFLPTLVQRSQTSQGTLISTSKL